MNGSDAFLRLFSDEASTPSKEFLDNLQNRYMSVAQRGASNGLSLKQKMIIGAGIIALILAVLALVLLPRRNMSDPTQSSIIESVVTGTQDTASGFEVVPNSEKTPDDQKKDETTDKTTEVKNNDTTTATETTPTPQTQPQSPVQISSFSASYWNIVSESVFAPSMPVGPAVLTNSVNVIDFNWGAGSPQAGTVSTDGFVARYTKDSSELSGQYKVVYSSDNGLRMHVNETVVFDHWNSASSSGTAYFTTDPASPITSITIDYYEADGNAKVSVQITKM